jgi:hypothetical protein
MDLEEGDLIFFWGFCMRKFEKKYLHLRIISPLPWPIALPVRGRSLWLWLWLWL